MSKPKHTPGPWERGVDIDISKSKLIYKHGDAVGSTGLIGSTHDSGFPKNEMANARLIATAPEMLEVLKDAVEWEEFLDLDVGPGWLHLAKAVIAKAEGKK